MKQLKKNDIKVHPVIIEEKTKTHDKNFIWVGLVLIALTTFIIYLKALSFDFLFSWDDKLYVTANNHIRSLDWNHLKLFFSNFYVGNYQPFTLLFYAINFKIGALDSIIYHFINIVLHIINAFLVFIFIRRVSPESTVTAIITSAFFAVHPMHVESVAWISELKDVLYSFFFLISLIIYTNYLKDKKIVNLLYVFILFVFSCLSKSAAVVLPIVLFLLDYYNNRKFNWQLIFEKIPFLIISLIFGIVAMKSQKEQMSDMAPVMTFFEHLAVVCYSVAGYLWKAVIPVNLSAIYPYPEEIGKSLHLTYYFSVLIVFSLIFFIWYSRKWGKDIIFGFLFFFITIILVLQLIPVGIATMADRYTYIPYIGLFFLIGKLIEFFIKKYKHISNFAKVIYIILTSGFIIFSYITYARVQVWENDETLFSDVIEKYPECYSAYNARGSYYFNYFANYKYANDPVGRGFYLKRAARDFDRSIKYATNIKNTADMQYNLGIAKVEMGDHLGAISNFNEVIKINPYYDSIYMNRAAAKYVLKDYQGTIDDCNKAIKMHQQLEEAYNLSAGAKFMLKDYKGALDDCENAIKINPSNQAIKTNRDHLKAMISGLKQ